MAKSFDELAQRMRSSWSPAGQETYAEAAHQFQTQLSQQATLGALLAQARKERSLTQPDLSQMTGIQQAEISRIERGLGNPTASTLLRLGQALEQKLTFTAAT